MATACRVSIHAPAWGATAGERGNCGGERLFQSTHPRGVRLVVVQLPRHKMSVSIHAPAWGATRQRLMLARTLSLFQSTHPRGVRHLSCRLMSGLSASFNPRTRVGCDFFKLY